jgi:hypothetical protein
MMSNPGRKEAMGKEPARKGGKTRPNMQSNQGPGTSESTGKFTLTSGLSGSVNRKPKKKVSKNLTPNMKIGYK